MLYVPSRLRTLRVAAGESQQKIAEWIDVPAATIGRWERGAAPIPPERQAQLADLFGVSVEWFMGAAWKDLAPETVLESVGTLRQEHREMAEVIMATVDLLGDVQEGRHKIHLQHLRHATAEKLRRSTVAREGALMMMSAAGDCGARARGESVDHPGDAGEGGHPMEVARNAIRTAAEAEADASGDPYNTWTCLLMRMASSLPERA